MDCVGLEIRPEFPRGSDEGESKFLYAWIASLGICKTSATIIDQELIMMLMACQHNTDDSGGNNQIQIKHFS